jgi:undecaprenyl-diphosphatase
MTSENVPSSEKNNIDKFAKKFPTVDQWDKQVIQKLYHKFESSKIPKIARIVSLFGDPKLWIPTLAITFIIGIIHGNLNLFLYLFIGFIQSYLLYYLIKRYFKRPRPFKQFDDIQRLDKTGHGYSFPSGHAHHSTMLVGLLILYFYPRWWMIVILILYNICVSTSRMISGVHFPSDTIVGIIEAYVMIIIHVFITKHVYLILSMSLQFLVCQFFNFCPHLFHA